MISLFGYPPTEEQLGLLVRLGINNISGLLFLRCLTLGLMLFGLWWWYGLITKMVNRNIARLSVVLLLVSPVFWVICLAYPLLVVKVCLVIVLCRLSQKLGMVGVLVILVIVFNLIILGQRPAILSKVSFKDAAMEVTQRFQSEDSLRTKMELPLWWRRVSYNKYFMVYKQVMAEVLPFFDIESVFFQEVHPMEQKSVVMFYWPEVFLFLIGIYHFKLVNNKFVWGLSAVALVNFVFADAVIYQRLYLVMLPLSLLIAAGTVGLWKNTKILAVFLMILVGYGCLANLYDITRRPDYWLDNRPLVFDYWYSRLKNMDRSNYTRIQVSSLVGESTRYCEFYLGEKCKDKRFVFESFSMGPESLPGLYLGFTGEFVGSRFKNDFDDDWEKGLAVGGMVLVEKVKIRDTVAYKYGNDIGLVIKQ